jgi:hypothetical protein
VLLVGSSLDTAKSNVGLRIDTYCSLAPLQKSPHPAHDDDDDDDNDDHSLLEPWGGSYRFSSRDTKKKKHSNSVVDGKTFCGCSPPNASLSPTHPPIHPSPAVMYFFYCPRLASNGFHTHTEKGNEGENQLKRALFFLGESHQPTNQPINQPQPNTSSNGLFPIRR